MARDSFANALTELYNLLASDSNGTPVTALSTAGVVAVYDHEPKPGDGLRNCFVTVAPAGMTPEYWVIAQRVYSLWDVGAKDAQDKCLAAMVAVDEAMTDGFGPSNWNWEPAPELGAFVATNILMVGRDDLSS